MTALSELTTIRVGGVPAEILRSQTREELIHTTREVWATGEEWLILGGGSNLVAADDVENLHVIKVETKGIERLGPGHYRVQAGENWDDLVAHVIREGLGGIESLSGIPGTVGAAPMQNIGAYGQEVAETILRIEFLDYATGELSVLEKNQLGFGYRDSIFKHGKLGLITWVEFQFVTDLPAASTLLMQSRREEVLELRASKGMVLDANDSDTFSCGSFFTNPIVSDRMARTLPADAPKWPIDEGDQVKLSAAWLIEQAGINKGFKLGHSLANVSSKHTLAIVNRGGATARDVLELARFIQERVAATFGINLVPEPNLVGNFNN